MNGTATITVTVNDGQPLDNTVARSFLVTVIAAANPPGKRNDFDGDGRSDIGCYYPPGGNWYGLNGGNQFWHAEFGYAGTLPITGDFDGDGRSDIGCYYPPGGNWYVMKSTEGFATFQFGYAGTIPIVGDFDGDGTDDFGCYDPAGLTSGGAVLAPPGSWYIMQSTDGFRTETFGYAGTIPIVGDFDGDGKSDFGCYDPAGLTAGGVVLAPPGSWYIMQSTGGFRTETFGYAGTIPVVGDFDGDGRSDFGCYYPAGGNWYVMQSTEGFWVAQFGYQGTIPLGGTLR
jgi:hypothetical protein